MTELVSIVTPVYNCVAYLRETVKSVQEQSYSNWEMLLVDDGSTDGSAELVDQLAREDSRIKAIHQPNAKQGKARNNGISQATGNWIAFLDADDLWPANKLEFQLQKTLNTSFGLSFTDGFICLNNDMNLRAHRFGVVDTTYEGESGIRAFHAQNRIPTSTVIVKKELLIRTGGFPEHLSVQNCEDYLLWVKLLKEGATFISIGEALLYYRVHPTSSTSQETKALFPVIEALMSMASTGTPELKNHLGEKFRQLIFRLNELGELNQAAGIIPRVIPQLYQGVQRALLLSSWKLSPAIFIRVFWRMTGGRIKN